MKQGDRIQLTAYCGMGNAGNVGTVLYDAMPGKPAYVRMDDSGAQGYVQPYHMKPAEKPKPRQQAAPDRDDEQAERLARADAARRRQEREQLEQFFASGKYKEYM